MSSDMLLSDLCSICNINISKYRCPGCSTRTCSLPCSQRHKQWAQCSGKRDPTKFVKKSDLVTPAGIDHDYNFLSGIERDIEKADAELATTGDDAQTKPRGFAFTKAQINYQHLESAGVTVIRAPKGMSRQRENKSHRAKQKKSTGHFNIVWTVEWLDDQKKRMLTETSSTCVLSKAQPFYPVEAYKGKKRKHVGEALQSIPTDTNLQDAKNTSEDKNKSLKFDDKVIDQERVTVVNKEREHSPAGGRNPSSTTQEDEGTQTNLAEAHNSNSRHDGNSTKSMGDGVYRLFLVKPRTSSSRVVLIPLDSSALLGDTLRGRVVLEFPTIYCFPNAMAQLPEEFMLEEEYLKQESEEQKEFDDLINELDPEIRRRLNEHAEPRMQKPVKGAELDDKAILDVLKKDFGGQL